LSIKCNIYDKKQMIKYYIYYLEKNNIPFYIGYTKNITNRINAHRQTHGLNTEIIVLDTCLKDNKKFWETFYINLFKSWGFILENKNNGGGGPLQQSESAKNKYKEWRKGKKPTLGKKQSEITIQRKREALTGKPKPEGFGEMMRKVRIGKPKPKGFGEKISLKVKGQKRPTSKPVTQFDINGNFIKDFRNAVEAGKETNSNPSSVSKVCRGLYFQTNGFCWKFKNEKDFIPNYKKKPKYAI
jgi:hypothetical protein